MAERRQLVRYGFLLLAAVAISFGAGGEVRQPLGLAVVGGLMLPQFLTLYLTPVVYLTLDRLAGRREQPALAPAGEG